MIVSCLKITNFTLLLKINGIESAEMAFQHSLKSIKILK